MEVGGPTFETFHLLEQALAFRFIESCLAQRPSDRFREAVEQQHGPVRLTEAAEELTVEAFFQLWRLHSNVNFASYDQMRDALYSIATRLCDEFRF